MLPPSLSLKIAEAVDVLRRGGLVGLPTETVYGLAADAENPTAVLRIFAAKGRPSFHPLIVHIPSAEELDAWAVDIPDTARQLADRFWPGPLTMILPRHDRVPGVVTGDLPTVGLRVPAHPVALELLRQFGGGLAAPSANRFGRLSPTTAEHVAAELGNRVDLILDGGPCQVGVESTIVDLSRPVPTLLRPGGISAEELCEILPNLDTTPGSDATHCSGRLESHYAPRARVEIVPADELDDRLAHNPSGQDRTAVLSHRAPKNAAVVWLKMPESPAEYAHKLYATMRQVDDLDLDQALIVLPTEASGLAQAIADRVRKAAAPRPTTS